MITNSIKLESRLLIVTLHEVTLWTNTVVGLLNSVGARIGVTDGKLGTDNVPFVLNPVVAQLGISEPKFA
jgi:hypothetical protein